MMDGDNGDDDDDDGEKLEQYMMHGDSKHMTTKNGVASETRSWSNEE